MRRAEEFGRFVESNAARHGRKAAMDDAFHLDQSRLKEAFGRYRYDPYAGIKTKARRTSWAALELQQRAFAGTAVGKRNARGRKLSNPMAHPLRKKAFDEALQQIRSAFPMMTESKARDLARRKARIVPIPKKARAAK